MRRARPLSIVLSLLGLLIESGSSRNNDDKADVNREVPRRPETNSRRAVKDNRAAVSAVNES